MIEVLPPPRRGVFALLSALVGAGLPKCPMCWAMWMSAAGVARTGGGRWMYLSEGRLMLLSVLCLTVAMVWFLWRRRCDRMAVCGAALAVAFLAAGKFWLDSAVLVWSGMIVLIGFTIVPTLRAPYRLRRGEVVSGCCDFEPWKRPCDS